MNKEEKLKKEKKAKETNQLRGLRVALIIFIIILLSLISFVGIYVKDKNEMSDIIPDFILGSDIEGNRIIQLNVEKDETITLTNSTGAKVASGTEEELSNQGYTDDVISENGYTKTSEETNKEEVLTSENYEKSKQILVDRLKTSGVTDYKVRQDKDNGNIVIELKENDSTDDIISTLSQVGKFELKDSDTEEILLNNDDVKDARVLYNNTQSGVSVYLEIEFNKQGKEKLQEISKTYNSNAEAQDTTNTVDNTVANEITEEDLNNAETTNETTNTTSDESTEAASSKKIDMVLDGTKITQGQQFSEENLTGTLDLLIGTGSALSTSDENNNLDTYISQAQSMASLLKNGVMPITYSLENNKYIEATITVDLLKNVIIVLGAIAVVLFIFLIIKFRVNGILATISNIGFIAVVLLILRLTNVEIGIGGIIGLALLQLLNYVLLYMLVKAVKGKKDNDKIMKNVIVKFCMMSVPAYIIAIVFAFNSFIPIYSFGMVVFWGLTTSIIYNLVVTKNLIIKAEEK